MKTCSLEVIILDLDTGNHLGSYLCFFIVVFCLFFVVAIFGVLKTCFIITRALLSAFYLFVVLLAYMLVYYMK